MHVPQPSSGLDARLHLRWDDEGVRGELPRKGSLEPIDTFVDTAFGLLVVGVAGVAVPLATASLMITAGTQGWGFPALIAGLFLAGILTMAGHLAMRLASRFHQQWFGVQPWRFSVTRTHVEWSGPDLATRLVRSFSLFGWTARRRVPLSELEAVDVGSPDLQVSLLSGEILFLDVDPTVGADDLEALSRFLMHRAELARQAEEGRVATTAVARRALEDLTSVSGRGPS